MSGSNHHVYFSNRYEYNMDLDRDDTDSYGPETITIRDIQADKKYEYYVFNYSHQELYGTSLSYSNARVRVIIQNEQVKEFYITPGMIGRTWHVFDIINGNEIVVFDELIEWKPEVENDYSGESSEWNEESETIVENNAENTEESGETINSDSVNDAASSAVSSVPNEISEEDKLTSKDRHVLMTFVGKNKTCNYELKIIPNEKKTVLLCSDGLYNQVPASEIANILSTDERCDQKVSSLIAVANHNGGSDNIAVSLWEAI